LRAWLGTALGGLQGWLREEWCCVEGRASRRTMMKRWRLAAKRALLPACSPQGRPWATLRRSRSILPMLAAPLRWTPRRRRRPSRWTSPLLPSDDSEQHTRNPNPGSLVHSSGDTTPYRMTGVKPYSHTMSMCVSSGPPAPSIKVDISSSPACRSQLPSLQGSARPSYFARSCPTLETTLGQRAPPKSGRVQECHLIQVAF